LIKGPDIILLHINGSIDVDLTKLSATELMMWGLANLWHEGGEEGYAIRHGCCPVSNFSQPQPGSNTEAASPDQDNFFKWAYPGLFPYGYGGIEADQP